MQFIFEADQIPRDSEPMNQIPVSFLFLLSLSIVGRPAFYVDLAWTASKIGDRVDRR